MSDWKSRAIPVEGEHVTPLPREDAPDEEQSAASDWKSRAIVAQEPKEETQLERVGREGQEDLNRYKDAGRRVVDAVKTAPESLKDVVAGAKAGLTSNFDDEAGAGIQGGMAWLARHSPAIAEKLGIETKYASDDSMDPTNAYNQAVKENRVEKRAAKERSPWAYGAGELGGTALQFAALPSKASGAVGATLSGAVNSLGDSDEHRGFNRDTAVDMVNGGTAGFVGHGVANAIGLGIGRVSRWAGKGAQAASDEIAEDAARSANGIVNKHNGEMGPPAARANKFARDVLEEQHKGQNVISPQLEAQIQADPQFRAKIRDQHRELLDQEGEWFKGYEPKTAMKVTPGLVDSEAARIRAEGVDGAKAKTFKEAIRSLRNLPAVKDTVRVGQDLQRAYKGGVGSAPAREAIYKKVQRMSQNSSDFMRKYGRVILNSSRPEVAHNLLMQRDPEYREAVRNESEDSNDGGVE